MWKYFHKKIVQSTISPNGSIYPHMFHYNIYHWKHHKWFMVQNTIVWFVTEILYCRHKDIILVACTEIVYWCHGDIILVAWRYYTGGLEILYWWCHGDISYWWLRDIILVALGYQTGGMELLYWLLGDIILVAWRYCRG